MSQNSDPAQEQILVEPYKYILQVPGKQVREKFIQAFNVWLKIPEDKLMIISDVVKMLHNSSLICLVTKLRTNMSTLFDLKCDPNQQISVNKYYGKRIDDIEDNSKLRRGIPVAHNIFGVAQTINSANYMYFKALEKVLSLNQADCINVFTAELLELHRGQGMDIYWRDSYTCPTEDEYRDMVRKKTGGLFRVAVKLMQLFSDSTSDFLPLLDTLALFFQIRDDYANLLSEEYKENKSFCEDLTEGKFSFPIIHGIRNDPSSTKIMNILKQRTEDIDIKKYCVDCLEQMGSFSYTKIVLKELEARALQLISELGGNTQLSTVIVHLSKLYSE